MTVPIQITMFGQMPTPPYQSVTWTVWNAPDNTGAQSGFGVGYLQNIGVSAVSAAGSPVNPISLDVSGDLTGSLPSPSVVGIQGQPVLVTTPTVGQVLRYNGTQWAPHTVLPVQYISVKIESGDSELWETNCSVTPSIAYQSVGMTLITVPGMTVLSGAAWANYAASGGNNGFITQAYPQYPTQPSQIMLNIWSSMSGQASDPPNPDDILTVFFLPS